MNMDTIPYGLLTLQKQPVPLKDISVSVHVKGILADVTATLLYKNELQDPLEAVFVFPMDDEAAVYNFEALIDGKTITAEIKEKDIARQVYDDAISSGQQAFLLEEDVMSDVFSCTVGNLPPEKEAAVSISYVIQLSLEADQALRFVLPAVLNPRYTPADCPSKSVIGNIPRDNADDLTYMLHLSLKVEGAQEIQSIKSNCELTDIVYNANMKTSAQISLKEGHKFDRDVEILIYYRDPCLPYALVEKGKPEAAEGTIMSEPMVMLNMYPEMGSGEENTHQDFIFVVDRSGSMQSNVSRASQQSRIATAKDTLVLLLKSLRVGCLFNIYGFGNSFTSFFKSSVEYNQESMDSALEKLKNFEADLGGTEILKPLKDIFSKSVKTGYHRQVFLLTDGEVNNTANVIEEVKNHATTHRFFTLGIGEGASTSLIKGMAKASHGKYEFITGKDRMQKKVLKCLKLAYQPSATNISLEWKVPSAVEPLVVPRVPEVVFHQQRTVIYAQLKELENSDTEETQAVLKYSCGEKKYQCVLDFTLTAEDSDSQSIHYMAAKAIIKDGEGTSEGVVPKDDIDRITKISIESNVISPYTAYTAVHKDSKEPVRGPMVQQIIPLYNSTLFCGSPGENLREYNLDCSSRLYLREYNLDCSTRQYLREYNLDLKKVEETKQIPVRGKSSSKKKKGGCFPIKLPKLGSFRVSKKAESKKVKEDHQDDTKELEDEGLTGK
ncbi:von Willebrand factor A domain-containing protein 5A-like [Protopterus annectens]|uniref:von Willebrand factor A domain-containing protein 5A-like n=1 Tax=Protopterus annectens TaxID=7888 RepID=UPI001CFA04E4|nr:von Willebrand factor A domain-containing protein 5A-like [Protopterus annectens]